MTGELSSENDLEVVASERRSVDAWDFQLGTGPRRAEHRNRPNRIDEADSRDLGETILGASQPVMRPLQPAKKSARSLLCSV